MQEFIIKRMGHLGDGITETGLFAPRTLPGELVQAKQQGQTLIDRRILTPSSDRVSPPCPHFKTCGGCQVQHASDAFVARWKTEIIVQALAAHGLKTRMNPILTSPPNTRRRASFAVRRTKKGALIGFHAQASDQIVEIPNCALLHPDLLKARPVLETLAQLGGSRKSTLKIQATQAAAGLDLLAIGGKPLDDALRVSLAAAALQHRLARLSWNNEVVATLSPPEQPIGPAKITPPPGSFLQATQHGETSLIETVGDILKSASPVLDLFSGCGTFSLPLAQMAEIHAVEGEADMLAALDKAWRKTPGLKKISHEKRDLFRRPLLPDELNKFEAAVIDPPRAGAQAQVTMLAQTTIKTLAYVSCNPVSFARDAKILTDAGYSLEAVTPVDQFRWSYHAELVGAFHKRAA